MLIKKFSERIRMSQGIDSFLRDEFSKDAKELEEQLERLRTAYYRLEGLAIENGATLGELCTVRDDHDIEAIVGTTPEATAARTQAGGEWSHTPAGPARAPGSCLKCSTTEQYVIHVGGDCSVVARGERVAVLDERTCPACEAAHGSSGPVPVPEHAGDEPCRCVLYA